MFIFLLLGSLFAFYITKNFISCLIVTVIILIGALTIAIFNKRIAAFLIPIICFGVGVGCFNIAVNRFEATQIETEPSMVKARIYNTNVSEGPSLVVSVDSLKFNNKSVSGRAKVTILDYQNRFEDFTIGTIIEFSPYYTKLTSLFDGEIPSSYNYKNDFKYEISTGYSRIQIIGKDTTFAEKLQAKVKQNLSKGLSNENVEIAYAAMFGDKSLMPEEQYSNYQLSGAAHILAVSGLHVSIIVGVLYAFCKLIHIKGWKRFFLLSAFLLFYMYLCNYSVSVVRASIMSIILMLAPLVGRRYDTLSALSFAGIIIYIANPFCIFDISFLMSFSCVLGITFMFRPILRALTAIHTPKWLGESMAVSVSTVVSLLLIMAYFFKRVNLIAILTNILILPIFTVAFEVVFAIAFLSIIFPFLGYLLLPLNYLFNIINSITFVIANLKFANISSASLNYHSCLVYFFLLMILGRICTAKQSKKVAASLGTVALLVACLI